MESETILRTRDFRTEVWRMAGLPINGVDEERAGAGPTQELVDAYEIVYQGQAYPLLDLKKPYKDDKHLEPNYNAALPAGALNAYLANPTGAATCASLPPYITTVRSGGSMRRTGSTTGFTRKWTATAP